MKNFGNQESYFKELIVLSMLPLIFTICYNCGFETAAFKIATYVTNALCRFYSLLEIFQLRIFSWSITQQTNRVNLQKAWQRGKFRNYLSNESLQMCFDRTSGLPHILTKNFVRSYNCVAGGEATIFKTTYLRF